MSRVNIFATHKATGYRVHIEVDLVPDEGDLQNDRPPDPLGLTVVNAVLDWLAINDYLPRAPEEESTGVEPEEQGPACPACGGDMWDNRKDKKNPAAPDYKCKDAVCGKGKGVIWPPRDG